ncbi:MAG: bifunctional methylenetetrahydrofolate dehydrogenase/methenyltetrahydrofolate cyclohydrolase FolD [Erysipelotrichaceae bacterium]
MEKYTYGSELAIKEKAIIKQQIRQLEEQGKRIPTLAVIMVGNDPASKVYVNSKDKACAEVGMQSKKILLQEDSTQEELMNTIQQLNEDSTIDGILVQMPLPKHLDELKVIDMIHPTKDVDGLTPENVGRLHLNLKGFIPCTPKGIMRLLDEMGVEYTGKRAVVIGRSKLVGSPVAKLLESKNCTVTICHSKTQDIKKVCQEADIIIAAVGKARMIDASYIKKGAYVIDVGINRVDGKLCGDVDMDSVYPLCQKITPVPKGVGPMTIAMLLENTMEAYYAKEESND